MKPDIEKIIAEHYELRTKLKAQSEESDRKRRAHDAKMRLIDCAMKSVVHQIN